jgi:hypothetical protein
MPTIFRDKVILNDVTFNDALSLPTGAGDFAIDVMSGWSETPELDAQFAPKGIVDGVVPPENFPYGGRIILLGGYVTAVSRLRLEELWDVIVRDALPRGLPLRLERHEAVPKYVTAYLSGPREPAWFGNSYAGPTGFRWGATILCTDPMKYGLTPQILSAGVAGFASGGRTYPRTYPLEYDTTLDGEGEKVTVTNNGTGSSKNLVLDITGPLVKGAWRVTNETTNELLKFDVGLSAGDHLIINFLNETALLNGFPVSASIVGDFWDLDPGPNVIKLFADYDPAAGFTATAYPAWE